MERLSGLDAFFLYMETEAVHMHVALTAVLDPSGMPGGYSPAKIQARIAERIHLVPFFTKKLVVPPLQIHHPYWVDDQNFRIVNHVRHVTLPKPGGPHELGRLTGDIASAPLDRRRPLWELFVIDGLYDGNIALVAKVHHSCLDGVAGVDTIMNFFDLERDAPPTEAAETEPEPAPTEREVVADAIRQRLHEFRNFVPLARKTARNVAAVRRARKVEHQAPGGTPLAAPQTPFNGSLTPSRNVAYSQVSLDEVKKVKGAFGCTVNDIVLAICAGALRRYLLAKDELPERPLLATCPVSVRSDDEHDEHNNKLSGFYTSLCTDIEETTERVRAIQTVTDAAKREHEMVGVSMLSEWADVADPTLFNAGMSLYARSKLADRHRPIHNLMISSIPGPTFPIYMAGAEMVRAYPMGPVLEGSGLNITVMSYVDHIDFGFMVCDDLLPDVWVLAAQIPSAFEEIKEAADALTPFSY